MCRVVFGHHEGVFGPPADARFENQAVGGVLFKQGCEIDCAIFFQEQGRNDGKSGVRDIFKIMFVFVPGDQAVGIDQGDAPVMEVSQPAIKGFSSRRAI
jgi:hypothetical protein